MPLAHPRLARVLIPTLLGSALYCAAMAPGQQPVAPHKSLPATHRPGQQPAARMSLAGAPGSSASVTPDATDALQARLDAGERIPASGATTLRRPLVIRKNNAGVAGFPHASFKTDGFPAIMAGFPDPARRPRDFIASHRVDGTAPGMFAYRLPGDAYLSLRTSPFEFGPAANWDAVPRFTLAFAVRRERADLNNRQDAVLCTDPVRAAADPLAITVQGRRVRIGIRGADDVQRDFDVLMASVSADVFIVFALDTATGRVVAYANGVAAEIVRPAVPWTPGMRVRWPDLSDCMVGRSPLSGNADLTVHGLKLTPRVVVPMTAPVGTPLARNDGRKASDGNPVGFASFLWDRHYSGEAILDMRRSSVDPVVPELVSVRGGSVNEKRGYGMLLPADWNPYDVISGVEIEDLTIQLGDDFQGSCVALGACLDLHLADLDLRGGLRGIDQYDPLTSYPVLIERVRTAGQGDAGIVLGYGIVTARDLSLGTGPAPRSHYGLKNRRCNGVFSDIFIAEQASVLDVIRIGDFMGPLDFERVLTDWENYGPRCYVRADRGRIGRGQAISLHLKRFTASRAPRDGGPYFRLADGFPTNRDGTPDLQYGRARFVVEDSLEVAAPGPMVRADGAWGLDGAVEVKGRMAEGVEFEPVKVPVPDPVPGPTGDEPVTPTAGP